MIGHHMLEGKIVNLSKPLAVLKRRETSHNQLHNTVNSEDMVIDGTNKSEDASVTPEYDIVSVVKRKVLFSKRPMPITSTSALNRAGEEKSGK